ncbi:Uncharacterised protein [Vibrio cholerae]|nr:Uncharacterised protein [Vibrio cholerae]
MALGHGFHQPAPSIGFALPLIIVSEQRELKRRVEARDGGAEALKFKPAVRTRRIHSLMPDCLGERPSANSTTWLICSALASGATLGFVG